ncbi:hypothetical protein like AT5G22850 [Hibiscus trionum]|uniref:Peptidase A1 domain-containing protein n=1 Tax=Hibiscus trionum TaxID=183268 RepID=A0A9W7MU40_HIBTR|nr:hypothetical protein like AT5G22850 [Hibiscus trionum]
MAAVFPAWVVIMVVMSEAAVVMGGFPTTLKLERSIPLASHELDLSRLRELDRLRHGRLLQSSVGVVDFPVRGIYDPFLVGLYYTKLQLGSPPREFHVQIDTGSDVLWIGCNSCKGCPKSSGLQIPLKLYDPGSSSTASTVSCSDERCSYSGIRSSGSSCSGSSNRCSYTFQYGDGSGSSGYYVSDLLHFNTIVQGSVASNATANIMFGCSTSQTGNLTSSDRAVDGIFGFGQQSLSVVSQLSSQGVAPSTFSHCLKGSDGGGGILVLGEIVEPNMSYTPLVPSMPHYNLDLRSISVGGQVLPIDKSVFSTSINQGTIVDSGTTLSYLADEAYDAFVDAIEDVVSETVQPILYRGNQCYLITTSANNIFPEVSLNFAGGASLVLNPEDYLIMQNSFDGAAVWCIGFQKIEGQSITILGDLVLKDKIFVYDLGKQRIGWKNYDCSSSVNVSATIYRGKTELVNAKQMDNRGSSLDQLRTTVALLLHIFVLAGLLFS